MSVVYRFVDQEGVHDLTREQILAEYFAWWSAQMTKVAKADQITEDACIDDWMITHWGWKVDDG